MAIPVICIAAWKQTNDLERLMANPLFFYEARECEYMMVLVQQVELPEWVKHWRFCPVYFKVTPHNWGCGGARQRMADIIHEQGHYDYLIFLDDDVIPTKAGWLDKLTEPLRNGYHIAGVDSRRLDDRFLSVPCPPEQMTYTSGGRCAIRAEVFAAGCEFDPQFWPNYYEDADLCYQARAKGFKIACVENTGLEHEAVPNSAASALVETNRAKFAQKWGNHAI